MQKGIFLSLAAALFGYAKAEENAPGLSNIEALSPLPENLVEKASDFLKTPVTDSVLKQRHVDEEASMRFWTPAIPDNLDSAVQDDDCNYDYIVVGCGSSGCPLAGFIGIAADTVSKKVLVLERGIPRSPENTPQAMNIWGAGLTYTNPDIAQVFITQQGVRTFAAAVTGGSTSINLGLFSVVDEAYLEELLAASDITIDKLAVFIAKQYITAFNGFDMPTSPLGLAFSKALEEKNIPTFQTASPPPAYTDTVQRGFQWAGQTSFFPEGDFPRDAADNFLFNPFTQKLPASITLKTQQTVEKIEFDNTISPPAAVCVVYHATTKFDTSKNGKSISPIIPEPSYLTKPITEAFLDPLHAFDDAEKAVFGMSILKGGRRRVCINPGGKIILAAGTIHSTTILYNSGVGPRHQIEGLGRSLVVEHSNLGQEIIDSVMIPVTGYLAEGPTVPYAGAGTIGSFDAAADSVSRQANGITEKVVNSVGNVMKAGADIAAQSVQGALKNPAETVKNIVSGTTVNSRSADPTRAFKFDLNSLTGAMGSNINLGPFTPGQIVGNSMFGVLPPGQDPYFNVELPKSSSEFGIWPDMTLRFDYLQPGLTPPHIGEIQSTVNQGNECPAPQFTPDTLTCSAANFSSFYGGRISEGFTIATRNIFPPLLRDDPLVDKMMRILLDCSNDSVPYNNPLLLPLCEIVKPTLSCLRRQFVAFTIPVPKSRGKIKLFPTGLIDIKANYLNDERDFMGAIRATSTLIDAFESDAFEGLLQPYDSKYACPYTVLNGLLDLMTSFGTISNPITPPQNIKMLQGYLHDMIPLPFISARRLAGEDGKIIEADAEKMEEMGIMGKLQKFGLDTDALKKHDAEGKKAKAKLLSSHDGEKKKLFNKKHKDDVEMEVSSVESEKKKFMPKLFKKQSETESEFQERRLEEEVSTRAFIPPKIGKQRYATFPPLLPSPEIPVLVGKYAQTYMASTNSMINSYPLGSVVDDDFNLIGATSLVIADRGVLTVPTRSDLAADSQVLGVYAAFKVLKTTGFSDEAIGGIYSNLRK